MIFRAVAVVDGQEYFRISADSGRVTIDGTSPSVQLTGFDWYLKYVAHADLSWDAGRIDVTNPLPLPPAPILHRANVGHRLFGNDIWTDYTAAHWGWAEWQHEIDLLALHGYNEVFMPVGLEDVAHRTLQEYGYSRAEMLGWTPPPAHLAAGMWQGGWTLADGGISETAQQARVALGRKIADRLRSLGMTPVFPGFVGFVPDDFAERNPAAHVVDRGYWFSQRMLSWLDPTTQLYQRVAARFYTLQNELFGSSSMYAMNPFTEGGTVTLPLDQAGKAIEQALQAAHPGAIWEMHAWQSNPSGDLIKLLNKETTFVVDFQSDRYPTADRETQWGGTPYAFGSVWNFGGHTTIGGNLGVWNERYRAWRNKSGSAVRGIALSPEAGHGDVLPLEFFAELAWRDTAVDLGQWFTDYAIRRYGAQDAHAVKAWQIMGATAYATPADGWDESQDGLFAARPSLIANTAAFWSPTSIRYDAARFAEALGELLAVAPELRGSATYRLDLMSVARQVLDNDSRLLLPQIRTAYNAKNLARFRALTTEWENQVTLQDRLAGSVPGFLLGTWVEQARAAGADAAEQRKFVADAKQVLTTWGDRQLDAAGLNDYCNRGWNGLIGTFYLPRWQRYFATLDNALVAGTGPAPIDWFALDDAWVRDTDRRFPTSISGDTYSLAGEARLAYQRSLPAPPPPPPSGTTQLSDLEFLAESNGVGPVERDHEVGGPAEGDGGPLRIAGVSYAKGLGTNSPADVQFYLAGRCSRFTATVGIDDTMWKPDAYPTVVFRVYADDKLVYDSGLVDEGGVARTVSADVSGAQVLRLVVEQVEHNWWDRADWVDPVVTCAA
ncbi:MAG TPA: alpha-N-acetylglucosaminidase TIM-barrel domain-containing protein [Kribbellaceae bacterium]|nr:alpha-N-acetylglucosaminidase TIM-barrel domain-containing protein [Kribbellaceae bacterium]